MSHLAAAIAAPHHPRHPFTHLPIDVLHSIISFLDISALLSSVACVSRSFRGLVAIPHLPTVDLAASRPLLHAPPRAVLALCSASTRTLRIDWSRLPADAISQACRQMPALQTLSALGCHFMDDELLAQIATACPRLARLTLSRTSVTALGIANIMQSCVHLSNLSVKHCWAMADDSEALGAALGRSDRPRLSRLALGFSAQARLADSLFGALRMHAGSLTRLELHFTTKSYAPRSHGTRARLDEQLALVAPHLTHLESLTLINCPLGVAEPDGRGAFAALMRVCGANLVSLHVNSCWDSRHAETTLDCARLIAAHATMLQRLSLRSCDESVDNAVLAVVGSHAFQHSLLDLSVTDSPHLTPRAFAALCAAAVALRAPLQRLRMLGAPLSEEALLALLTPWSQRRLVGAATDDDDDGDDRGHRACGVQRPHFAVPDRLPCLRELEFNWPAGLSRGCLNELRRRRPELSVTPVFTRAKRRVPEAESGLNVEDYALVDFGDDADASADSLPSLIAMSVIAELPPLLPVGSSSGAGAQSSLWRRESLRGDARCITAFSSSSSSSSFSFLPRPAVGTNSTLPRPVAPAGSGAFAFSRAASAPPPPISIVVHIDDDHGDAWQQARRAKYPRISYAQ
jgi:hypothetical protein